MKSLTIPCVLSFSLLGCGGGAQPTPTGPAAPNTTVAAPSDPSPVSRADASCSADADCEIVQLACCDHCNGGRVGAFNHASAAKHRPTCPPTACTERGCPPVRAVCVDGQCSAVSAP